MHSSAPYCYFCNTDIIDLSNLKSTNNSKAWQIVSDGLNVFTAFVFKLIYVISNLCSCIFNDGCLWDLVGQH